MMHYARIGSSSFAIAGIAVSLSWTSCWLPPTTHNQTE